MNYAIMLSGGIGTRMKSDCPKQYLEIKNKPILIYSLEKISNNKSIDRIVIVSASEWKNHIKEWIMEYKISKKCEFALSGESRQESIYNGLEICMNSSASDKDNVIIMDAVRPLVSDALITRCLNELKEHDGCMPVIPINDTIYQSTDGKQITGLLNRNTLFAGQSPEAFNLWKYSKINRMASKEDLQNTRGTTEIAYKNGLNISLIEGEELNYKITTPSDFKRLKSLMEGEKNI